MEQEKRISRRDFLRISGTAAAGLGLLAACGPAASTNPTVPAEAAPTEVPTPAGPVAITYWYWADSPQIGTFFRTMIANFNYNQSALVINAEAQPNTAAAQEKLVTSAAAGAVGADVSYGNTEMLQQFYTSEILLPVGPYFDQWEEKNDIFPGIVETHKIKPDQPLLYMPWGLQVDYHYYRSDLYEKAGLKPPDTFGQLVENAKALNNPPDTYGFGLRAADRFGFLLNLTDYLLNHGLTFSDGKGGSDLDSPLAIEVIQTIAQLYWDGVAQPSAVQDRFPQMVALLQEGKIAQWSGSINHSVILKADPGGEFEDVIGITPFPKGEGHDRFTQTASAGNMLLKDSKNPDAGWEWIVAMMRPDNIEEFSRNVGFAPVRKSVAERPYFKENRHMQMAFNTQDSWGVYPYWHKNWLQLVGTDGPQLWQRVLLKEITVEEMAKQAADIMRDI